MKGNGHFGLSGEQDVLFEVLILSKPQNSKISQMLDNFSLVT